MAFTYSPKIVTDGLVFAVDAANTKSYPGSGTTWSDLSGNGNNGTLVNGPTYDGANGGSIVFDGSNDYGTIEYTMPSQSSTTTFTWNLWIYLYSGNASNDLIFGNRYGAQNLQFIKITPTQWEYYGSNGQHIPYNIPTNQWVNICVVKNQGISYYYSNASQVGTIFMTNNIVNNPIFMGADAYSGIQEASNVKIASAVIYNRALSPSEVSQNYNALKGRFGL